MKIKKMKFKKLEWIERDCWIAKTPAANSGYISIVFEEGKYWPLWTCDLPGFETLEEAISAGQDFHEAFLKEFLE